MKRSLPIAILVFGALGATLIASLRPGVEPVRPEIAAPLVQVEIAVTRPVDFVIRAHGTVTPRTESDLVSQVSGPVVWVSPALASGGFFELDDPLIRIDRADYDVVLESARAAVARTTSEHDRAKKDLERQNLLAQKSIASAARFDDAVNGERIAAAALREALALRERAERDVERTEILAPYAGRVRDENVDAGQFVTRGTSIGRIYAVDYAEVRLPVPDAELRFIELPMLYRGESADSSGPVVRLHARFAGGEHTWEGRIVRTEGEIDSRSRMVNVVARVEDPYARAGTHRSKLGSDGDSDDGSDRGDDSEPPAVDRDRPPLAVGLFVEAEIQGRRIESAIVLPRAALRNGDEVLIVDAENRLRGRKIEVLRSEDERIVVGGGLRPGEAVVVSPLPAAVEGMTVRIEGAGSEVLGDEPNPEDTPAAAAGRT